MVEISPPIKEEIKEPVIVKDETIIYNVDPVVPTAYIKKPPLPIRIKDMLRYQLWFTKVILKHLKLLRKLK